MLLLFVWQPPPNKTQTKKKQHKNPCQSQELIHGTFPNVGKIIHYFDENVRFLNYNIWFVYYLGDGA